MNDDSKLNTTYVCRCACGQTFASAYMTTPLCPGCAMGLLVDFAPEPDGVMEPDADDGLFAATGYLCCHPFGGFSLGQHLAYRTGRVNWPMVLLALVIVAVGYGCTADQASAGGWDQ